MGVELSKQALDVGIVTANFEQMMTFYRDVLGFIPEEPRVFQGLGTIYRMPVGQSILRLFDPDNAPAAANGSNDSIYSRTGIRYLTLTMNNLHEVVDACRDCGINVARPVSEFRPGVFATTIQDPDGNWIEMQSG
jgi:catechol 2,3-dioxygenase-like lactoylglutathione lyase family enzyme